jgi:hypothetical protein
MFIPLPPTRDELIAQTQAQRALLNAVLERIPAERMTEAGAVGRWSVKDVLAHLAVWQSRAITLMFQAERNGKPIPAHVQFKTRDFDAINARDDIEQRDRPLDRILADFHGAHTQCLKRLGVWPDERGLFDPKRYPSLDGVSLVQEIWLAGGEHDAEHRADLEAWLARGSN